MALQQTQNSPVHAELIQPKYQPPVTTDPRMNRNKHAISHSFVEKGPPCWGCRVRRWQTKQHPLWDTQTVRQVTAASPGASLQCAPSAASWVLSVPFDLCGSSGCSGPLKSHFSLMPGYCKILFPSYPGLPSLHQPHLLIQTFKNENRTKTAFFHFSFPNFTLSFLGLWSAKSLCTLNIPGFADWQVEKNQ